MRANPAPRAPRGYSLSPPPVARPCAVGHIVSYGEPAEAAAVVACLAGSFFELAFGKYASNVVEKALRRPDSACGIYARGAVVRELVTPRAAGHNPAIEMLNSVSANYVLQAVADAASDAQISELATLLRPFFGQLGSSPGGRKLALKLVRREPALRVQLAAYARGGGSGGGGGGGGGGGSVGGPGGGGSVSGSRGSPASSAHSDAGSHGGGSRR